MSRDRWAPENLCTNCLHPKDDHLEEGDRGWCTLPAGTCIFNPCGCKAFVGPIGRPQLAELTLQNIPIRTEVGDEIREAFTAVEAPLTNADYCKIEQRLVGLDEIPDELPAETQIDRARSVSQTMRMAIESGDLPMGEGAVSELRDYLDDLDAVLSEES